MEGHFDPKRFVIRERFKFWSEMKRKPGESIQELVTRIRQDAAKCDFSSIVDPRDEAMRTRFICSVNNEAVLKALFKIPDDELFKQLWEPRTQLKLPKRRRRNHHRRIPFSKFRSQRKNSKTVSRRNHWDHILLEISPKERAHVVERQIIARMSVVLKMSTVTSARSKDTLKRFV